MQNNKLLPITVACISHKPITMILLSTRSLERYAIDISTYKRLIGTAIFCLTETHIVSRQNMATPEHHLSQCQFCHNKSWLKFQSLVSAYRGRINIVSYDEMPARSFITFSKAILF